MEEVKVSIIIPIYEVEKHIERCINSVINQTCPHHRIECILIDDCGTDKSVEIALESIKNYSGDIKFRIIHNKTNCGLSVSRNNGIKVANGEFLFFLDSDDYITPDCIEILLRAHYMYPEVEVIKANHIDRRTNKPIPEQQIPSCVIGNHKLMKLFFLSCIPAMAWNTLISRDLVEKKHLFFKPNILYEDILWSFYLYSNVEHFLFLPDITLSYEVNPNSIVNKETCDDKRSNSILIIIDELIDKIDFRNYVGIVLYITTMILVFMDKMKSKNKVDEFLPRLLGVRNKLFFKTCCDFRIVLSLFELFMFNPFKMIFKLRFIRNHYDRLLNFVWLLASSFSLFHGLSLRHFIFRFVRKS